MPTWNCCSSAAATPGWQPLAVAMARALARSSSAPPQPPRSAAVAACQAAQPSALCGAFSAAGQSAQLVPHPPQ